jgi:hypothetical protein
MTEEDSGLFECFVLAETGRNYGTSQSGSADGLVGG